MWSSARVLRGHAFPIMNYRFWFVNSRAQAETILKHVARWMRSRGGPHAHERALVERLLQDADAV